jgi:hypothetical protein
VTRARDLPPDVSHLLELFLAGLRDVLDENLLGVYFRGSLAIGGFDPETSDVDVLVVSHERVSETEFEALREMHDRLRALPNRFAEGLEVAYIDAAAARQFKTGQEQPNITSHDPFRWERFESNWVLDLWMAREHSPALYGAEAGEVFGTISPEELRRAASWRLREWAGWIRAVPEKDREWLNERCHQAYVVETICRGLLTVDSGSVPTKRQAVEWALATVPEQWHAVIEWSQQHRSDEALDDAMVPMLRDYINWAAGEARGASESS